MRTTSSRLLTSALVVCGVSAAAVPAVEPVTQLQRVPNYEVVFAVVMYGAVRAAKEAGDHQAAKLYERVLQAPISPEDVPRYQALAKAYGNARRAGNTTRLEAVRAQLSRHATTAYAQRASAPATRAPATRAPATRQPGQLRPRPAPWREYTRMSKLRDRMNAERAVRQRVKVRTAEVAIGNELPLLYPAFHWLPYTMMLPAVFEWSGQTSKEDLAEYIGEDPMVVLFSLFNVKIYMPDDADIRCCAPEAKLTVELAASAEEVDLVDIRMVETAPGVYRVADPFQASNEVLGHVVTMGSRPLFSVVRLDGVGYRGTERRPTIAYAVRWGDLELEFGSHSWLDPEAVIR